MAALGALCERVTDVEVAAVQLEVDAATIPRSLDTDERSRLVQQVAELEAQKVLASSRATVAERRDQLKHLDLIAKAKGSLRTRIVTDAGKQIAESAVTAELRDSWAQALLDLGLSEARVKMKKAGSKGNYLTCLELDGCTGKQGMTDVLSEGEQRVVALAAFMAELGLAEQGNAVVFDDPVSSLDHNHRELVAKSIVRLAESRQVIVFTHDLVFLADSMFTAKTLEWQSQSVASNSGREQAPACVSLGPVPLSCCLSKAIWRCWRRAPGAQSRV